ncbi:MBL fold metallo-hydrolase, partial [bacterium]|nr:MBL fold metallo-hydrolase [bacterium]
IDPVPAERVVEIEDGTLLDWGTRQWRFLHTRGHANHHFVLWDSALQASFTGDSFGVYYPSLQKGGLFIFPSTSPTDFDAEEARISVEKISSLPGDRALLTHFGELRGLNAAAVQLYDWIDFSEQLVKEVQRQGFSGAPAQAFCEERLNARFEEEMRQRGVYGPQAWKLTGIDRKLNAMGLAYAAGKNSLK